MENFLKNVKKTSNENIAMYNVVCISILQLKLLYIYYLILNHSALYIILRISIVKLTECQITKKKITINNSTLCFSYF